MSARQTPGVYQRKPFGDRSELHKRQIIAAADACLKRYANGESIRVRENPPTRTVSMAELRIKRQREAMSQ